MSGATRWGARGEEATWYKDAILYEVHVRAFADSNGDGIGDFAGLCEKLDYLQDLGITALWLLPFYPSPLRDGGYDISDYTGVHPDYGTKDDFLRFLEGAHRRGLKVITELVINHTSTAHAWFQRARRAPPGSPERDFYVWSDTPERYGAARIIFKDFEASNWTWDPVANAYYWHRFFAHQPDLNFDNPAVHEALFEVLDHWLALGVDGVRLDAVPYLYEREGTSCENLAETHAFLRKLRARVDERFAHRMLLAEANQWPIDAAAYFGNGDECHMNFHFPLMPRLFMSVDLEDSFPIVDILAQTPAIPESCQWATFLRNHDELTLEMVTEEERDYMYRVYAREQRARLNLGIRRRLAPLLGDRRRMELLNAILFSLPGTPVLYYGDEIGMGDNIYLGDRDGVRTPMQWNADRNAGFSRATPQRLYLPLVVDPHYHYEAVNVEAQQASSSSMLWWMKRLIAMRRRTRLFGRGELHVVTGHNSKVLAFVRQLGDACVLFVANLSRFPQHEQLHLEAWAGAEPVEMLGRSRFPKIEGEPWGLSLGPYDYFWFELERKDTSTQPGEALRTTGTWWQIAQQQPEALAEALAQFVERNRWSREPGRRRVGQALLDGVLLTAGEEHFWIAFLRIDHDASAPATFAVPLAFVSGAPRGAEHIAELVVEGSEEVAGSLIEASSLRGYSERLLAVLRGGERVPGHAGALVGQPAEGLEAWLGDAALTPRSGDPELTNTLIFYGQKLALKVLRRFDEGTNAEAEMTQFLSASDGRALAPRLLGTLQWRPAVGEGAVLALLTEQVAHRSAADTLFADGLRSYFERVLSQDVGGSRESAASSLPAALLAEGSNLLGELTERSSPERWFELIEPLSSLVTLLGRRTAELHLRLGADTTRAEFAPEPFNVLHQQSLYQSARGLLGRTAEALRHRLASLPEMARWDGARFLEQTERIDARLRDVTRGQMNAVRIRAHGDLHLGQVLFTGDDFVFVDFEGEPTRLLRERRYKRCPLRDVASMVMSITLQAEAGLQQGLVRRGDVRALEPWARAWSQSLGSLYVTSYSGRLEGSWLLPEADEQRRLLRFYMLERCLQEIHDALHDREAQAGIPLASALNLLNEEGA